MEKCSWTANYGSLVKPAACRRPAVHASFVLQASLFLFVAWTCYFSEADFPSLSVEGSLLNSFRRHRSNYRGRPTRIMFLQLIGFTVKHECHGAILRWLWFAKTGFLYGDCTYLHMTVAAAAASATATATATAPPPPAA